MKTKEITPHVLYCGVNDREKYYFDNLYELPFGVSYNSYVVEGDEKIALIDGSDASHALMYVEHIKQILKGKNPDYIVVNHAEPDHTGALPAIRMNWPNIKIIGNSKTFDLLKGFYGITDGLIAVNDGDVISLGGDSSLKFIFTPMVHWPETMMTYFEKEKVIFSGDAFGCFGALNGAVIDQEIGSIDHYFSEAQRYYACIVAKYGPFVLKAIDKVAPLAIEYICSTHGPVWHKNILDIVDLYSKMANWESSRGVVVAYGSMYGSTTEMIEELISCLVENGMREIRVHEVTRSPLSFILADVMRFDTLVIVSPTYNTDIYPPVESFVRALIERGVTKRNIALMGSFAWGGQAVRKLTALISTLKGCEILEPSPEMRQKIIGGQSENIKLLAKKISEI